MRRLGLLEKVKSKGIELLEKNRGLVIVLFCLPASFIFDLFVQLHRFINAKIFANASCHESRVRSVQASVQKWNVLPESQRKPMCTAKPPWLSLSTTFFNKRKCHQIPINLCQILSLDEEKMSVKAEPNVSVKDITEYLVAKGYTLAVTLEIADATVGGLALGVGMTTHSHKVGLFQESVLSYEVVTGDGSLVIATADNEHSQLFHSLPWSHGTLGFLVGLELKVIKVKPYVHLRYIPIKGQKEYCEKLMELSGALDKDMTPADYLEATLFSKEEAVIMVGNFADVKTSEQKKKVNRISLWYKPWFYKHVESKLSAGGEELEEYMPLSDYLLRHNRAIFWVLESMIPFGNHPLFRFLFGWLCPPKPAFLKFTTTPMIREMTFTKQVFQDIVMPLSTLSEQVDKATTLFDTFPLLVYPCRIYDHKLKHQGQLRPPPKKLLVRGTDYAMFNDLGIYGTPGSVKRRQSFNATYAMREMEKFTREVGGYSFLYADIFMTREEFEQMFDLTLYEKVRKRYDAQRAFPHLFDKVKPEIDVIAIGNRAAASEK